jgi:alpha-N-acetylglucosaminidase
LIILDLDATEHPQYERLENYFGQPFIFNMLDNFGGNMALYGRVEDVITGPKKARSNVPNMIGTGLTPEGIFTNFVMYDLMSEMSWSMADLISIGNLEYWLTQFARRRYGLESTGQAQMAKDGLLMLGHTVYNCTVPNYHDHNILMINLPTLKATDYTWYSLHDIVTSLELFVEASDSLRNISTFQYDLADLTRQFLVNLAPTFYQRAVDSYNIGLEESLVENTETFLELVADLEAVLSTQKQFLFGAWLGSASSISENLEEKSLFEFNACNQVTLWGPDGQILDYAAKQWSGLVSQYYGTRWALFFDTLLVSLEKGLSPSYT